MASQLRVDEIIASTGSSVAIGTAGGSVTLSGDFTVDTSKGLNVGTGASIFSPSSNVLTLGTNSAERVRITSDGKVSIGGFNPAVAGLSISNSSTNRGLEFDTGSGFDSTSCIRAYDRPTTAYKSLGLTGSDIKFGINDVEKVRIDSSGNIGIGLTNPTYSGVFGGSQRVLHISGTAAPSLRIQSSTANQGDLSIQAGNSGADVQISNMATNGDIVFYTHPSGSINEAARFTDSGNLKFPSGQGIDFSADGNAAGMTSELLDDYEEGTWTPTWGSQLSPPNGATGLTLLTAHYVKVGTMVFVRANFTLNNASGTFAANTSITLSSLPFSPVQRGGSVTAFASSGNDYALWVGDINGTTVRLGAAHINGTGSTNVVNFGASYRTT
jgi:hypothetical protein